MPEKKPEEPVEAFEKAATERGQRYYVLRLCVTGITPRSVSAIENIRKLCEDNLKGYYELEVVDLYQDPSVAAEEGIIAAPTLIKKNPAPKRKLVGDLSDVERVLIGLGIHHKETLRRKVHDEE
ncbi:MAG: circadian clock KaiB family protein [Methanomicrobiaceae archaeon]|nr:circadian clock KaiB family protein [Methanomicrobiaceae archaeon]